MVDSSSQARIVRLGLLCVLWSVSAQAADVEVTVNAPALARVGSVVVLPLGCGSDAQCLELEEDVAQAIRHELGLQVVPREKVERAMDLIGLNNPQGHLAHLIAEEVGADAYLRVQNRETTRHQAGPPTGGGLSGIRWSPFWPRGLSLQKKLLTKLKSAAMELVATDGATLIQGHSKGRRGVLAHIEGMLEEAARQLQAAHQAQEGEDDPGRRR